CARGGVVALFEFW
nr:immunoglobulin heavy chain junction region [Macaca mulatta]